MVAEAAEASVRSGAAAVPQIKTTGPGVDKCQRGGREQVREAVSQPTVV